MRLEELNRLISEPGFWDDAEKANATMAEISGLKNQSKSDIKFPYLSTPTTYLLSNVQNTIQAVIYCIRTTDRKPAVPAERKCPK